MENKINGLKQEIKAYEREKEEIKEWIQKQGLEIAQLAQKEFYDQYSLKAHIERLDRYHKKLVTIETKINELESVIKYLGN